MMERQLTLQEQEAAAQIEAARRAGEDGGAAGVGRGARRRVAEERGRVMQVCEEFARERARYFAEVEAEVVKLALAIAARVLHREAKLDPLLLTAAVRVALEKVADNSAMELRVPAADVERLERGHGGGDGGDSCSWWEMSGWARASAFWRQVWAEWSWV